MKIGENRIYKESRNLIFLATNVQQPKPSRSCTKTMSESCIILHMKEIRKQNILPLENTNPIFHSYLIFSFSFHNPVSEMCLRQQGC